MNNHNCRGRGKIVDCFSHSIHKIFETPLRAIALNTSVLKLSRCGTLNWLLFIFGPEPLQRHTLLFFYLFYSFFILPLYQASKRFRGNPFKRLTTSVSMNTDLRSFPSYLQQKVPDCVIWIVCLHKSGFLYWNHRNFRTLRYARMYTSFFFLKVRNLVANENHACLPMYVTPPWLYENDHPYNYRKSRCLPTKTVLNTRGTGRAESTQRQLYVFMALQEGLHRTHRSDVQGTV